jgi:ATP-dependent DNA helicase RecG
MYAAVQLIDPRMTDILPEALRVRLGYPSRGEALIHTHFPEPGENLDALNTFRSPAQQRLIFEELFTYQLSLALDRKVTRKENAIAFRVREDPVREALKRILPFKPTAAQKRVLAEIAADLEKPAPMNRLLQGDVGSGKTIIALQAAVIAMENGTQTALMAPTEILAVQHFLSARRADQRPEKRGEGRGSRAHSNRRSATRCRNACADRGQCGVCAARLRGH